MGTMVVAAFFVIYLAIVGVSEADYPFRDPSLPFEDRVADLVGRLSISEIVGQMSHGGAWTNSPTPAIERLGIKPYQFGTECLSGDVKAGRATSFPQALGMAATFDYDLVYQVSKVTSEEVRAKNNNATALGDYSFHTGLSCWSPVVNIMRDPRWGRNQETFGECPYLSGQLADAFVRGLQGDHPRYVRANAGCKHFDVHGGPENIPVSRFSFDSKVSDRDWRMTFLPQFEACVAAGTYSLMCSYNSIQGTPACANSKLLTDILREEWGFKGYVVSDDGALENIMKRHNYTHDPVHTAAVAINAGTCLEDGPPGQDIIFSHLEDAYNQKLVNESTLRDCASRLFMTRMVLGEFDPPEMNPYRKLDVSIIQSREHRDVARVAAGKSFVLLKNDKNVLPFGEHSLYQMAVIGPFANSTSLLFGDYSPTMMEDYITTPLMGLSQSSIAQHVLYAPGCNDSSACTAYDAKSVMDTVNGSDVVVVCLGTGSVLEKEGHDRSDIELPGHQAQLLMDAHAAAKGKPVVLLLFNAGPLNISWAKDNVDAIIECFLPAQEAGTALSDVFLGYVNPAGRLPATWPMSLNQVPDIVNYTMINRTYRYFEGVPLYPFGYGLSYTQFAYSQLIVTPAEAKICSNISVSVVVENVGDKEGDEVVQVYIHWANESIPAPRMQLVGFERVSIGSEGRKEVNFTVTPQQMAVWTTEWTIEPTVIDIFVGGQQPYQKTSAPSNVLEGNVTLTGMPTPLKNCS
ncbi:uncharacterized protein [Oscarella lobularis]|uniref:uncharacterized protein isoform X2 n=1 Tax=Oscarella lobularis TaxID=121494 RepID=UPI003314165F